MHVVHNESNLYSFKDPKWLGRKARKYATRNSTYRPQQNHMSICNNNKTELKTELHNELIKSCENDILKQKFITKFA